jgi:hypothetical protein
VIMLQIIYIFVNRIIWVLSIFDYFYKLISTDFIFRFGESVELFYAFATDFST